MSVGGRGEVWHIRHALHLALRDRAQSIPPELRHLLLGTSGRVGMTGADLAGRQSIPRSIATIDRYRLWSNSRWNPRY